MLDDDHRWELAALTPLIKGTAIELVGAHAGGIPGTVALPAPDVRGHHDYEAFEDASVDAIVALGPLVAVTDWIAEIAAWRRVLRPGGVVGLALSDVSRGVQALIEHAGGFGEIELVPLVERGHLLTARRTVNAEAAPLDVALGPWIAELAESPEGADADLCFQIGSVLLDRGDADLARQCLEQVMDPEAGMAGLAACAASVGAWADAMERLQPRDGDPVGEEVQRWINRVVEQLDGVVHAASTP